MKRIAVLIVDDSAVVRQVLQAQLPMDPQIEVIGAAADPLIALERMKTRWPDVLVLDVEMPRMDGITFLKKIMAERPTPAVICSTLTERGAQTSLEALAAGAVAIVTKPKLGLKQFLHDKTDDLVSTIKIAANAKLQRLGSAHESLATREELTARTLQETGDGAAMTQTTERIVAIGTSTGGTQALEQVLTALPRVSPGIVIVQHMPEKFTAAFAARLDSLCEVEVREARHGDRIVPGRALIAPGGRHTMVKRSGAYYHVEVVDGPLVSRHKPSVDVLFRSVAKFAGTNALGIIMTGMGDDGARGLKDMRDSGAQTIAQDEATCVVFGMPKEAIKLGAAERVLPLNAIPAALLGIQHASAA